MTRPLPFFIFNTEMDTIAADTIKVLLAQVGAQFAVVGEIPDDAEEVVVVCPGASKRPTDFLAGSSLGQVISILARHGALRGRCGVEAGEGPGPGPVGSFISSRAPGSFVFSHAQEEWRVVGPHTITAGGIPHGYLAPVAPELVMAAALDHCPAAACRGDCPGVDPAEALAEFARRSGCTPEEVARD